MSNSFRVENIPQGLDAHFLAGGLMNPKYAQGMATPTVFGFNVPVVGPYGNIALPANALISRVILTGNNLTSAGAPVLQLNTTANSGDSMQDTVIGSPHAMATINAKVADIIATPLEPWQNRWLGISTTIADVTGGSIAVTVEYF
jgi:hypothetical protein